MNSFMKYSDEERAWFKAHGQDTQVTAWRPPARSELSASAVNGMTAAAQWGYKANAATPKLKVKGLPKFPCDANDLAAFHGKPKRAAKPQTMRATAAMAATLRDLAAANADLAAANARIAELEGILSAVRMELAA